MAKLEGNLNTAHKANAELEVCVCEGAWWCVCGYMVVCVCPYMHAYNDTCIYVCVYICMYVRMYVCVGMCVCFVSERTGVYYTSMYVCYV